MVLYDQRTPKTIPIQDVHTSARSIEYTVPFPKFLCLALSSKNVKLFFYEIMMHAFPYIIKNSATTGTYDCNQGILATNRVSHNISIPRLLLKYEIKLIQKVRPTCLLVSQLLLGLKKSHLDVFHLKDKVNTKYIVTPSSLIVHYIRHLPLVSQIMSLYII